MCVCMELIHVDTCKRTLLNTRLSKNGEALSCFAPLDMRPSLLHKMDKQQTLLYRERRIEVQTRDIIFRNNHNTQTHY